MKYPSKLERSQISLTRQHVTLATMLGNGNMAAGIRLALKEAAENRGLPFEEMKK